jgi:hypothetical protein
MRVCSIALIMTNSFGLIRREVRKAYGGHIKTIIVMQITMRNARTCWFRHSCQAGVGFLMLRATPMSSWPVCMSPGAEESFLQCQRGPQVSSSCTLRRRENSCMDPPWPPEVGVGLGWVQVAGGTANALGIFWSLNSLLLMVVQLLISRKLLTCTFKMGTSRDISMPGLGRQAVEHAPWWGPSAAWHVLCPSLIHLLLSSQTRNSPWCT